MGREMASCAQCATRSGWQQAKGLRFAAQTIRHEAVSEEELDLAEVCEFTAISHHRLDDGMCACGDSWDPENKELPAGCQAFLDVLIQKNFWLMRKVWRMRAKYKAVTNNVHAR